MHSITLTIDSIDDILSLFDPSAPHFFVHRFDPQPAIGWFKADLDTSSGLNLKDAEVRGMQFDLQTDIEGIRKILVLNTSQLSIYQFARKVPDTLVLEYLPAQSRDKILQSNGLRHFFGIDFEFLTVESFDPDFIQAISENPMVRDRITRKES
ncbi:hypothetical protein GCM10009119_36890 [Algoriphagus jejuensis]|uniref:Preprotein translocase subunit SecB n=1 Tax=Algoriphagus jejuensis TaxID=419934 RepID=A0ABN1N4A5_9BACT